jgi:hypothetical protein
MRRRVELHTIVFIANGSEDAPDTLLTRIRRALSAVETTVPEQNRTLNKVKRILFKANNTADGANRTLDGANRTLDRPNRTMFGPNRILFGSSRIVFDPNRTLFASFRTVFGSNRTLFAPSGVLFASSRVLFGPFTVLFGLSRILTGRSTVLVVRSAVLFGSTRFEERLGSFATSSSASGVVVDVTVGPDGVPVAAEHCVASRRTGTLLSSGIPLEGGVEMTNVSFEDRARVVVKSLLFLGGNIGSVGLKSRAETLRSTLSRKVLSSEKVSYKRHEITQTFFDFLVLFWPFCGYFSHLIEFRRVSMARFANLSASLLFSRRTCSIEKWGICAIQRRAFS